MGIAYEMKANVDPKHNSEAEYNVGGPQLSFEYKQAKAKGLSYSTAHRIFELGMGMAAIVTPLMNGGATTAEGVDEYIKSLGLWIEGDLEATKDALADHFLK